MAPTLTLKKSRSSRSTRITLREWSRALRVPKAPGDDEHGKGKLKNVGDPSELSHHKFCIGIESVDHAEIASWSHNAVESVDRLQTLKEKIGCQPVSQ